MAIGDDPGGNAILLGVQEAYLGVVYFWDHEQIDDSSFSKIDSCSNAYFLAASFSDFLNILQPKAPFE